MCFIIQFGNRFLYTDCRIIRLTDDKAKASQYELTTEGYLKSLKENMYVTWIDGFVFKRNKLWIRNKPTTKFIYTGNFLMYNEGFVDYDYKEHAFVISNIEPLEKITLFKSNYNIKNLKEFLYHYSNIRIPNNISFSMGIMYNSDNEDLSITLHHYKDKISCSHCELIRGKISQKIVAESDSAIYGDPLYILPTIYNPKDILKSKEDIVYIPYQNDFKQMIDSILESNFIISDHVAPIIIAHAYNIPAVFINKDNRYITDIRDYYSGLEEDVVFVNSLEDIKTKIDYIPNNIQKVRENVIKGFERCGYVFRKIPYAIGAVAKNESLYINEWIKYNISIGFTDIFILDNNDPTSPFVGNFIDKDIRDKVHIITNSNRDGQIEQYPFYNNIYDSYSDKIDWISFIDIDEYITLYKWKNISEMLHDKIFKDANCILLTWKEFRSDGSIYGDYTIPLMQRFTNLTPRNRTWNKWTKTIVRGKMAVFSMDYSHFVKSCLNSTFDVNGNKKEIISLDAMYCYPCGSESEFANIRHYHYKSLSEYIEYKFKPKSDSGRSYNIRHYFINNISMSKDMETYIKNYEVKNNTRLL